MPTITEVLQRQTGAIQGMDRANANAQSRLSNPSSTDQQLYNAKNDVRIASQEGANARYEATVYKNQNPSEYDSQITTNNELIQQRREQSFNSIQQIDQRIGPDYTPVVDQAGVGGDVAVTGTDENIAPDFTPVRGETQGATSSGSIVDNDAQARADGAGTQTPYPSHLTNSAGQTVTKSNANAIPTSPYGTTAAAPVTPDILIGKPVSADDAQDIQDDTFITSAQGGVKTAKAFYEKFESTENPTNKYAQLTYNIGLYLQTPEQYKQLLVTQNKTTQGLKKILQSGGSSSTEDVIFPDLYIDDLEVRGLFAEANQSPHNVTRLSFRIVEPMGYTFFQKLKKLCADNGMTEFSKQHYLMVIRYTGFDENGKQVSEADDDRLSKFIPFVFSKITSKVATGAINYDCQAVAINHEVALSAKRATIPFNVELLGQTLSDIFNATAEVAEKPAESTSQTTATSPWGTTETTVTPGILKSKGGTPQQSKGIIDALNKQQKKLATEQGYKYADKYKVTFKGDIGKQKIISSDALLTVKKSKPMSASARAAAQSLLSQNLSLDKSRQIYSIPAGTGIHQVLDIMIRSSEYITKQQTHIIDPKTGKVKPNPAQNEFLQWYHIGVRVLPIAWDDKRGDYAYEIEYIISPKQILDTYSPYFPKAKLRGVHKKYNYWFTGENTEILNYEQDLNTSFFVAMDGRIPQTEQKTTEDSQRITTKAHVNMSGSTGLGQPGDNASPAEQAANVIYSTVDFAMFNMDIIGDPDYVQQNDILYTSGDTFEAFMPDGSINYDSQEVLVEVKFRTMEDYKEDGSADLKDPLFTDGTKTSKGLIYKLTEITSTFAKGNMTQNIRGILREFDDEETKALEDTGREEQPFVGPTRGGMNMPGYKAVTYGANNYAPDFTPVSVKGNRVPGDNAITSGSDIAPNFTPISTAQNGQGQYDTAGPIGPDFTPRDNGNSVPGQRAVSNNPTAPNFLPVRGETQGN